MNFTFGVPSQRTRKVEKYPEMAVITMEPYTGEKGTSRKFTLNKKALDNLGFNQEGDEFISFSFDNGAIRIANTTNADNVPDSAKSRVTKKGSFSDKKVFDYIEKYLSLDVTEENEFRITLESAGETTMVIGILTIMSSNSDVSDAGNSENTENTIQIDLEESIAEVTSENESLEFD